MFDYLHLLYNYLINILAKQTSFGAFSYYALRPGQPRQIQQAFRRLLYHLFSGVDPIGLHIYLFLIFSC